MRASLDPSARLRLSVSMIFVERSGPASRPASLDKDHGNKTAASERRSHRGAGEAKRSAAAASRRDGDDPMWPPAT